MKEDVKTKENSYKIIEAIKILEEKNTESSWYAARLIFNLWYILLEPDFDDIITDKKKYERKLIQYTKKLYKIFKEDEFFLFILSYCMSISYWFFIEIFPDAENLPMRIVEKFREQVTIDLREVYLKNNKKFITKVCQDYEKYFSRNFGLMEKYFWEIKCKK